MPPCNCSDLLLRRGASAQRHILESVFKAKGFSDSLRIRGVAGRFDWQDRLDLTTSNNKQGWLLSLSCEEEGWGGGGAAMDAWREKRRRRRRMAWQAQTHSEHNVSAGSNKRHQAHLSPPLPPLSRFIPPPVCLSCTAFTRLSVCLAPRPAICVGWPLLWFVFFSSLRRRRFPPPLLFLVTPWTSFIQNIYPCLDVSLIFRPCPSSVLYLSVLLSPLSAFVLKPFPLGQLSLIY